MVMMIRSPHDKFQNNYQSWHCCFYMKLPTSTCTPLKLNFKSFLSTDCHSLHKQLLLPAAEKDPMVLEKAPRQRRELQAANVESCQGKYLLLLLLNSDGPTRFGAGHRQHVNPRGWRKRQEVKHENLIKCLRASFSLSKRNTKVNLNDQKNLLWKVAASYFLCQSSYGNVLALEIMSTV